MSTNTTPQAPVKRSKGVRMNQQITAPMVRLVDPEGLFKGPDGQPDPNQVGVMSRYAALEKAQSIQKDLVEIQPNAEPPVVRIMDYGKFVFDEKKKGKQKVQKAQKLKELKFRPVTDEGDYKVKLRNLMGFLEQGDKVKITIRFRGREIAHQSLGTEMAERIKKDVDSLGVIDQMPRLEGRQIVMVVSPRKLAVGAKEKVSKSAKNAE